MGPGCFHPRNPIASRCSYMWPTALQWGRDVSIPEIRQPIVLHVHRGRASMGPGCFHPRNKRKNLTTDGGEELQWGRDVSIPEMVGRIAVDQVGGLASMG